MWQVLVSMSVHVIQVYKYLLLRVVDYHVSVYYYPILFIQSMLQKI